MSETVCCRACGQPLPPKEREGVYLPAKKAAIFDTIKRHPGITVEGIRANCCDDDTKLKTIQQHIFQINGMLAATNVQIKSAIDGGYRLIKRVWVRKKVGPRKTRERHGYRLSKRRVREVA